jgi:hypothetical protein
MTTTIQSKFYIHNAKSKGIDDHDFGDIPFVSNGTIDNGIIGYVKQLPEDRIFPQKAICVSSFCEATVQRPPFIPRGNGGSGLVVLVPKEDLTFEDLYFYAAQINSFKWKFSFGRMVIADRIANLPLLERKTSFSVNKKIKELLNNNINYSVKLEGKKEISRLDDIFILSYGQKEYESKDGLKKGKTILISSKGEDKGCYGFFDIKPFYKAPFITVPRTGTIGQAFVQELDCCANSDCIILTLKDETLGLTQLYQIATQIRKIKWKYNYGRKITPERLGKELVVYFRKTQQPAFEKDIRSVLSGRS